MLSPGLVRLAALNAVGTEAVQGCPLSADITVSSDVCNPSARAHCVHHQLYSAILRRHVVSRMILSLYRALSPPLHLLDNQKTSFLRSYVSNIRFLNLFPLRKQAFSRPTCRKHCVSSTEPLSGHRIYDHPATTPLTSNRFCRSTSGSELDQKHDLPRDVR